jgi:ATP-dependent Lon protease
VLAFEFPYALGVIDRLLEDLIARRYVGLKPTILVGSPGSGKSRMARRLAELLGGFFWRHDASTADGGVIGGTARRWHSAEPAHPFLAISRSRVANPWVLVEEIEKAATRNDHGRFWDSLLAFLEPETAARYLDPALQVSIDVSHVAYLATANSVAPLPAPLRDRMRVLEFPEPRIDDLPHLLPSVINQLSRERGLDERWFEPLSGIERDAIAAHWHGGSVRRLKSYVEAVWRDRDRATARH